MSLAKQPPPSSSTLAHPASISAPASCGTPIVFVVDDEASVRESLESLIDSAGWRPETFASASEFLARPQPASPSCLVLDMRLPGLNGLDLQAQISADRLDMPIIFISAYGDVPMTVRAMKGGAIDCLMKPFRDDVLLGAVRQGLERSRMVLEHEAQMRALRERQGSLTRREREVMTLVVAGGKNKQIAAALGISEVTVKAHRGKMMQKMRARSLPHLVWMAARLAAEPAGRIGHARGERRDSRRSASATREYSASQPFAPGRQAMPPPSFASR
jgi:FixJ family two-component response regulator